MSAVPARFFASFEHIRNAARGAQPNIDELLEKHASSVANLRQVLADTLASHDPRAVRVPYDDIWLLRFILSNGEAGAEKAARATLKWRAEKAEMLARAAAGEPHHLHDTISKYSISEIYVHRTCADEPVQLIRAGISNVRKLMDVFSEAEVVEYMNFQKEEAFLACDEATRRTRRLVKVALPPPHGSATSECGRDVRCPPHASALPLAPIRSPMRWQLVSVVDMHSSKFADNDSRFFKALGKASKESEVFYPQVLQITVGIVRATRG